MTLKASVLIPNYRRSEYLFKCLAALARQNTLPSEVTVVWQGDDTPTRDAAESAAKSFPAPLRVLHLPKPGIVPAENAALEASTGDVIFLIDDDAVAPPDWIRRHLAHYEDPSVGAVGGPAYNFDREGKPFERRAKDPQGALTWYGRSIGNMYDHIDDWKDRAPREVDHLVGYNMSLRRSAFERFEDRLRPYWQSFEMDACLTVKASGFRVLLDFGNIVEHHPTNTAFAFGREGNLEIKVFNPAYNYAFVLAKHTRDPKALFSRLPYLLGVGSINAPGLAYFFVASKRYGNPLLEAKILARTWKSVLQGWRDGLKAVSAR